MSDAGKDRPDNLIYDWNAIEAFRPAKKVCFDDETLRDGLQSPSVTSPPIGKQIEILHLMNDLGIDTANIGLPGAGPHVLKNVIALAKEIRENKLSIKANCAARTVVQDIDPVIAAVEATGQPITVATFIGSSPIRQYAEGWTLNDLLKHSETAVKHAVKAGLEVMFVTEDTTRANPDDIKKLYTTAIECGATRLVICDTVGHATPHGTMNLIKYVRSIADATGVKDLKLEWHGHQDRGLGVINCMAAVEAGVDQIHGAALGIGERCGNAPMDQLLVNCKLLGWIDNDLSKLSEYCRVVSDAVGMPIPLNYPAIGKDAFETSTGVHAAAVIKAFRKGDAWLANRVYSGVPADQLGLEQVITVGPMSGKSNVVYWLEKRGYEATEEVVNRVFQAAKNSNKVLTDAEIEKAIKG